jgi:hypothetical protein
MSLVLDDDTPQTWLTLGHRGGTAVLSGGHVLATGLEPGDEEVLVAQALTRDGGPAVLVGEGSEIRWPDGRAMMHYDMTGRCQEAHAHVVFDPAIPSPMATHAAHQLTTAVIDPEGTWRPPAGAGADFAAYVQPERWTVLPVLGATLWAASAAGYGVREAMDWLASDQLPQIAAYCRSMAGPDPPPLIQALQSVVDGPAPARQQTVYLAWQALAPAEAIIRNAHGAQRLDFGGWLSARDVLVISLPPGAGVAEEQIVAALLGAANEFARPRAVGALSSVWYDVRRPRHWSYSWGVFVERTLVIANQAAWFRDWAAYRHDLLLGRQAHLDSLMAAGCSLDGPPPPGQVILARNGAAELLSVRGGRSATGNQRADRLRAQTKKTTASTNPRSAAPGLAGLPFEDPSDPTPPRTQNTPTQNRQFATARPDGGAAGCPDAARLPW